MIFLDIKLPLNLVNTNRPVFNVYCQQCQSVCCSAWLNSKVIRLLGHCHRNCPDTTDWICTESVTVLTLTMSEWHTLCHTCTVIIAVSVCLLLF